MVLRPYFAIVLAFGIALAASPDGAAAYPVVGVYVAGGSDAFEGLFTPATGKRESGGGYVDAGSHIPFEQMGSMTFAPDGSLWGLYSSGGGDAYFAQFDQATAHRTGPGEYLTNSGNIAFESVGAMAFAPDGSLWGVYSSGGGSAFLGQFNSAGQHDGGAGYLSNPDRIDFDKVGAVTFAPDGTLWALYSSGGGDAYFGQFDLATGHRDSGGAYLNVGGNLAFGDVGAMTFAPDGTLWGVYAAPLTGDAIFAQFDPLTGLLVGPGNVLSAGSPLAFNNVGAMAFGPAPQSTVPEPAQWALMLLGFSLAGTTVRRHRALPVSLVA